MSIKDTLIKLGSEKPELRPHIRPVLHVLSKTAYDDWERTLRNWKSEMEGDLYQMSRHCNQFSKDEARFTKAVGDFLANLSYLFLIVSDQTGLDSPKRNGVHLDAMSSKIKGMPTRDEFYADFASPKYLKVLYAQITTKFNQVFQAAMAEDPPKMVGPAKVMMWHVSELFKSFGTKTANHKAKFLVDHSNKLR